MNAPTLGSHDARRREQDWPDGAQGAAMDQFCRHSARFCAIIRRMLAGRLRTILDPEDLLQEVAVALLSKPLPARLGSAEALTHYIAGIARNIALVHNRKHLDGRHHSLHREVPLTTVGETEMPTAPAPDAGELAQHKEAAASLQEWLPLRVREIVMWIFQGYSVAEVASRFDIDRETVIMFLCTANNHRAHPEWRIDKEDALRLFQYRARPRRHRYVGKRARVEGGCPGPENAR